MSFVYEGGKESEETKFHGTSIFTTFWISVFHHTEKQKKKKITVIESKSKKNGGRQGTGTPTCTQS